MLDCDIPPVQIDDNKFWVLQVLNSLQIFMILFVLEKWLTQ